MAMDDDDDIVMLADIEDADIYSDPLAQRMMAFVSLANCADNLTGADTKDIVHAMMKKVTSTIKSAPTADLKVLGGGKT
jgi:hypothetical protein